MDPNPNNSYKTKKNFTGSYTEVNPFFKKTEWRPKLLGPNVFEDLLINVVSNVNKSQCEAQKIYFLKPCCFRV